MKKLNTGYERTILFRKDGCNTNPQLMDYQMECW